VDAELVAFDLVAGITPTPLRHLRLLSGRSARSPIAEHEACRGKLRRSAGATPPRAKFPRPKGSNRQAARRRRCISGAPGAPACEQIVQTRCATICCPDPHARRATRANPRIRLAIETVDRKGGARRSGCRSG